MLRVLRKNLIKSSPLLVGPSRGFSEIAGEPTFLEMAYEYFDEAAKLTTIRPDLLEVLKEANAVLKVNIPLIRDNGSIEFISAFRS
jgi:hypothetical protein